MWLLRYVHVEYFYCRICRVYQHVRPILCTAMLLLHWMRSGLMVKAPGRCESTLFWCRYYKLWMYSAQCSTYWFSVFHCLINVRIRSLSGPCFPVSDWIRIFPILSLNAEKYRPEKLQIRTLFTQCFLLSLNMFSPAWDWLELFISSLISRYELQWWRGKVLYLNTWQTTVPSYK